jgi:hypothetical protein
MNKAIIEKIQKLLALAKSENRNEAELASRKAQELLLKHNISMATAENARFDFTETKEELGRQPVEAKFIQAILTDFFFVKIIHDKADNKLVFVGSEENIQTALYVRDFLSETFKRLYKAENKRQGWKGRNRNAFYLGLFKGLKHKLEFDRAETMKANDAASGALVVIDKALVDFMKSRHENLKTRSHGRINAHNASAVKAGEEQGRKLNIARGVGGRNEGAVKALKGGGRG